MRVETDISAIIIPEPAFGKWCWMAAALLSLAWLQPLAALTVHRFGGEDLPRPDMEVAYEFVQHTWDEVNAEHHGTFSGLVFEDDSIAPQRFSPETNLAPILHTWGGEVRYYESGYGPFLPIPATDSQAFVFDGDPSTAFLGKEHLWWAVTSFWGFDFGVPIPITRIRLSTRDRFASDRWVQWFEMYATARAGQFTGSSDAGDVEVIYETTENVDAVVEVEMSGKPVREVGIWVRPPAFKPWEIAEIEIFSSGFIPEARYRTNVIDLLEPATIGELTWSGTTGPGARIDLRLRGGDDDDPGLYHRKTFGGNEQVTYGPSAELLSRSEYEKLDRKQRGAITYDSANWGLWSGPVDFPPDGSESSRPRRFIQCDISFLSSVDGGGRVDYLQFVSSRVRATNLVGEIDPAAAPAGAATTFAYRFRPQIEPGDPGFDTIAIDTPLQPLVVEGVRVNGVEADYTLIRLDDDGFAVRLPHLDVAHTMELIEIIFRAEVFEYGTLFAGRVYDSSQPGELPQPILAGDADELTDGNSLHVALEEIPDKAIHSVRLSSRAFSPNGDGVNDLLTVQYELLNLRGGTPLTLTVYDLSGSRLGQINGGEVDNGRGGITWDGTLSGGRVVLPGIYLLELMVAADVGDERVRRAVSVVY